MDASLEDKITSDLKEFEKQLQQSTTTPAVVPAQEQMRKVRKNLVLCNVADASGCGHIRTIFPFTYLNTIFGPRSDLSPIITPGFIYQQDLLISTRSIWFQRQMSAMHFKAMEHYKQIQPQFKFKMVYDIDDYIWGKNELQGGDIYDGVPSYNPGWTKISDEVKDHSVKCMNLCESVCVSSQFLGDYIKNKLGVTSKIVLLKNTVAMYQWGTEKRRLITKKLEKPRVTYSGSPTHYHNGDFKLGDWNNAWKDYIIKAVKENKIEFTCMGGLPWFFECIKDKIKVIDWVNSLQYPLTVKATRPDIIVMPLVPNNFNYSKSDIKAIESYAVGAVAIGTVFGVDKGPSPYDDNLINVPYNCSVADIDEKMNWCCETNNFNETITKQYKKLITDGRYLEDSKFINFLTSII